MLNLKENEWTKCSRYEAIEWCRAHPGVVVQHSCGSNSGGMSWNVGLRMMVYWSCQQEREAVSTYGLASKEWRIADWSPVKLNQGVKAKEEKTSVIDLKEGTWIKCNHDEVIEWCKQHPGVVVQHKYGNNSGGMSWNVGLRMMMYWSCQQEREPVRMYGITSKEWRIADWSPVKPRLTDKPRPTDKPPTFSDIEKMWETYCKYSDIQAGACTISYSPSEDTLKVNISRPAGLNMQQLDLSLDDARELANKLTTLLGGNS